MEHEYFVGSAHNMEFLSDKDNGAITLIKTFFINDQVNINNWQVDWNGLKKDANDLLGVPIVLQEDLEHPKFSEQHLFDKGTIYDYEIDEPNKRIIVYARITDKKTAARITSGELQYVSPAVIPRSDKHLKNKDGIDYMTRTLPVHLAIVGNPAYSKDKAKIAHKCTGDGETCNKRLKMMTAATEILEAADECVSRKIQIIKREKPGISNQQAAAIAYSYCGKSKTANLDAITQTPFIKKVLSASIDRIKSNIIKVKSNDTYYTHHGKIGQWVTSHGLDVFVGNDQTVEQAIMEASGKFKPDPGEKPDKDGKYWRKIGGRSIPFGDGEEMGEWNKEKDTYMPYMDSKSMTEKDYSGQLLKTTDFSDDLKKSIIDYFSKTVEQLATKGEEMGSEELKRSTIRTKLNIKFKGQDNKAIEGVIDRIVRDNPDIRASRARGEAVFQDNLNKKTNEKNEKLREEMKSPDYVKPTGPTWDEAERLEDDAERPRRKRIYENGPEGFGFVTDNVG